MNNPKYSIGTMFAISLFIASPMIAAPFKAVVVPDLKGKELQNVDAPMKIALSSYTYAIYKTSGNERVYIRFNESEVTFYPGISGYSKIMATPSPLVVTGYKGAMAGQIHINPCKTMCYPFVQALYWQPSDNKIYAGGQRIHCSLTKVKECLPIAKEIPAGMQYTPDVIRNIIGQVKTELQQLII